MSTRISKNFTLEELISSDTAIRKNIGNTPSPEIKLQLKKLVIEILQPIRDAYKHAINVTSGYRCDELNKAVGGSKTSQHLKGQAVDIKASVGTNAKLFNLIKSMIESGEIKVGQLIWEYGTTAEPKWIHISLPYTKINNIIYLYSK